MTSLDRLRAHRDRVASLLIIVIATCVCWPWLGTGKAFYWGDIGLYFGPMLGFLRREMMHGRIPLWNPYIFCGTPYVGNPQTWIFYPSTALLALCTAPVYIMVNTVLHLVLAGLGGYYWLRRGRCGAGFWAALLGACTYMLGGFVVTKTQFPNMTQALAYTPWLLLATERLVAQPVSRYVVRLGALLGLQTLAAHAQLTLFTGYLMLLYGCWRWVSTSVPSRLKYRMLWSGLMAGWLAVGLACVHLLPVSQLATVAGRQHLTFGEANRFFLPFYELTNFIWPYRFGSPMFGYWRAPGNFWETAWYVGWVPAALAMFAIVRGLTRHGERWRDIVFWALALLASMLLALGGESIFYPLAFVLVPGVNRFHDPARMLLGAAVAVPVLAAIGLQEVVGLLQASSLRHNASGLWRRTALLGATCLLLTVLDLGAFDRATYPVQPVDDLGAAVAASPTAQLLRHDPDIAAHRARIVMADPKPYRILLYGYHDFQQQDPRIVTHWTDAMIQNVDIPVDVLQAGGYEPVALKSGLERRKTFEAALPINKASPAYANLLGQIACKYLITFGPQPIQPTPDLTLVWQSDWERQGNRARVYMNTAFQPRACIYNLESRPQAVTMTQALPDEVTLNVPPAVQPRRLVLADTAYAGWTAYANGQAVTVNTNAEQFREVHLAPASVESRVVFVYEPAPFKLGLFITLMTLSSLVTCCVQRKPRMHPNAGQMAFQADT